MSLPYRTLEEDLHNGSLSFRGFAGARGWEVDLGSLAARGDANISNQPGLDQLQLPTLKTHFLFTDFIQKSGQVSGLLKLQYACKKIPALEPES